MEDVFECQLCKAIFNGCTTHLYVHIRDMISHVKSITVTLLESCKHGLDSVSIGPVKHCFTIQAIPRAKRAGTCEWSIHQRWLNTTFITGIHVVWIALFKRKIILSGPAVPKLVMTGQWVCWIFKCSCHCRQGNHFMVFLSCFVQVFGFSFPLCDPFCPFGSVIPPFFGRQTFSCIFMYFILHRYHRSASL